MGAPWEPLLKASPWQRGLHCRIQHGLDQGLGQGFGKRLGQGQALARLRSGPSSFLRKGDDTVDFNMALLLEQTDFLQLRKGPREQRIVALASATTLLIFKRQARKRRQDKRSKTRESRKI